MRWGAWVAVSAAVFQGTKHAACPRPQPLPSRSNFRPGHKEAPQLGAQDTQTQSHSSQQIYRAVDSIRSNPCPLIRTPCPFSSLPLYSSWRLAFCTMQTLSSPFSPCMELDRATMIGSIWPFGWRNIIQVTLTCDL